MDFLAKLRETESRLSKAINWAITIGCLTILLVIFVQKSENTYIWLFGNFLGGLGNDFFLISTNILLLVWAWRQRVRSIITLTLGIDLIVWVGVQGIKMLKIHPWYLRPNGGEGGFPSGHATHAFAMAFLLTMFFPRLAWLWYAVAAAISWSRVETEWHTGLQVAAGVIFGSFIAWGMIYKWLKHQDVAIAKKTRLIQAEPVRV